MLSARDVAEYFLCRVDPESGDSLSNLKLQKLVYYAQGYHLAMHGTPLFPEVIEAWEHGPVVPVLYRRYKQYGSGSIPAPEQLGLDQFNKATAELLDEVHQVYGQYSAWKLRDMTHAETPWIDAYNKAPSTVIGHQAMREFFETQLVDVLIGGRLPMPSIADLSQAISAYRDGGVSLGNFEDWFRTASRSMFGESEDVLRACMVIEAAFSELRNGEIREPEFAEELANAIGPFVAASKKNRKVFVLSWSELPGKNKVDVPKGTSALKPFRWPLANRSIRPTHPMGQTQSILLPLTAQV